MRVIFMGTPDFAVPCLKSIHENYEIVGVFTQPDKPQGRGKKIGMSAVKNQALKYNLPIYQPESIRTKETRMFIEGLKADVIVVVAYGQLLSQKILDVPPKGCINVHASLLPAYRGSAPINWAIVNGESKSGVTTMKMVKALDAGPMIHKLEVAIDEDMTAADLLGLLSEKGGQLILKTLEALEKGPVKMTDQEEALVSFAPLMDKSMARIDWSKSGKAIHDQVRGFNPWPVAYTEYQGQKMKIFKTQVIKEKSTGLPGTLVSASKDGLLVNTVDGQLLIEEIQLPNKKRMHVKDFILGHDLKTISQLGE